MSDEFEDYDFPSMTCQECGFTTAPGDYMELDISDAGYWSCPECGYTHID